MKKGYEEKLMDATYNHDTETAVEIVEQNLINKCSSCSRRRWYQIGFRDGIQSLNKKDEQFIDWLTKRVQDEKDSWEDYDDSVAFGSMNAYSASISKYKEIFDTEAGE